MGTTEIKFFSIAFYLSDDVVFYERKVYNILDLISDFGGLYAAIVLSVFRRIGLLVNKHVVVGKLVRSLYFIQDEEKKVKTIKLNGFDKLKSMLKFNIPFTNY